MVMYQSIVVSACSYDAILLINKLFELKYTPENIAIINYKDNDFILENFCKTYNLSLTQIHNDYELLQFVKDNKTELLINIGGIPYLVSQSTLDSVQIATINLHTAITEEYRGRWMASWAIINGDSHCGYTWHHINKNFDSGNILLQQRFKISPDDSAFSLNRQIINNAVFNLKYVIDHVNTVGTTPSKLGHYYDKSTPFNGKIQDQWDIDQVEKFIRAMYHPPYSGATYQLQTGQFPNY